MEQKITPLTAEQINENIEETIKQIGKEFQDGFTFLKKYPKSVSIFGSARFPIDDKHYIQAVELSERIVKDLNYAIITGGGPGIMQACNQGARMAKGTSLGFTINLPREQARNEFVDESIDFKYFFTRKALLTFSAEAFVFFPGGFGTFDELFGILTLIQTNKIPRVPVILIGKDFWNPVNEFIKSQMLDTHHSISKGDMEIYHMTDSVDDALAIIKKAEVSEWWNIFD